MQSHLWRQLTEFFPLSETMNPGINNNVTSSLMSGIFCYQHKSYFQKN